MRSKIKIISNKKGFTIVEALIVLAVTGMLFVSTSFLIRGQIEKVRYQDSMRQLQQLVQNTIDDVDNGYLVSSGSGNSSTLLIGKKFWFCGDSFNPGVNWDGCPPSGDGSLFYTSTLNQDIAGMVTSSNQLESFLPGGLKFTHFKTVDNSGTVISGPVYEFGSRVMYTDFSGNAGSFLKIGKDISGNPTAQLFSRQDWWGFVNGTLSAQNSGGFMLCFQGYKKGSLEIGSEKSGTKVLLNIEDPRCN